MAMCSYWSSSSTTFVFDYYYYLLISIVHRSYPPHLFYCVDGERFFPTKFILYLILLRGKLKIVESLNLKKNKVGKDR